MFRGFVNTGNPNWLPRAQQLLVTDPLRVAFLMEHTWQTGQRAPNPPADGVPAWYSLGFGANMPQLAALAFNPRPGQVMWDHLIYAYLIENTRIFEVFHRVLWELSHGERLGIPTRNATFQWWRTTEELFYKDASPFQPRSLVSRIRPDIRESRQEAFFRFFGVSLTHYDEQIGEGPRIRAAAANLDFIATLEEFLRQVWIGVEYATSQVGSNPTDAASVANLALRLQNMLIARRGSTFGGQMLSREEFDAVAAMSWLHLTVLFDSPIVLDLHATAPSPEERLRLIGEKVGLPAHARSHSYFMLAPALSTLLIEIEAGLYSTPAAAPSLYLPLPGGGRNPVREMLMLIITHWSLITGRDLKATRVSTGPAAPAARPASALPRFTPAAPAPAASAPPNGNGRAPAENVR